MTIITSVTDMPTTPIESEPERLLRAVGNRLGWYPYTDEYARVVPNAQPRTFYMGRLPDGPSASIVDVYGSAEMGWGAEYLRLYLYDMLVVVKFSTMWAGWGSNSDANLCHWPSDSREWRTFQEVDAASDGYIGSLIGSALFHDWMHGALGECVAPWHCTIHDGKGGP